jgi:hypothetical protein
VKKYFYPKVVESHSTKVKMAASGQRPQNGRESGRTTQYEHKRIEDVGSYVKVSRQAHDPESRSFPAVHSGERSTLDFALNFKHPPF